MHCVVTFGLALSLLGVMPDDVRAQREDGSFEEPEASAPKEHSSALGASALSALPAGHYPVFLVPYMRSATPGTNEWVATVISITNVGGTTSCPTSVDWRVGVGTSSLCTTTLNLGGGTAASNNIGQTAEHCSRFAPNLASCYATCNPQLTADEGKVVIGTTSACLNRLAVDARLHQFASNDAETRAIVALKVIRLPYGNKGE